MYTTTTGHRRSFPILIIIIPIIGIIIIHGIVRGAGALISDHLVSILAGAAGMLGTHIGIGALHGVGGHHGDGLGTDQHGIRVGAMGLIIQVGIRHLRDQWLHTAQGEETIMDLMGEVFPIIEEIPLMEAHLKEEQAVPEE